MKLVIGGAFQGKKDFAQNAYHVTSWADGRNCDWEEVCCAGGILHFHEYIRRMLSDGRDPAQLIQRLAKENPDVVIVTNELGYGVVPVDAFDRKHRETTGRVCTQAACQADTVIRVVCGIGQVIKG